MAEKGDKNKIKAKDFERPNLSHRKPCEEEKMVDTRRDDLKKKLCDMWDQDDNKIEICKKMLLDNIFGTDRKQQLHEHYDIDEYVMLAEEVDWDLKFCEVCNSSPCTCTEAPKEV